MAVKLELFDPGGPVGPTLSHAPRLPGVDGMTICELSNGEWQDNRTFPAIRQALQALFPAAKIVPYTELPIGVEQIDIEEIGQIVQQKGCQAAIVGNAA